MEKRNPFLVAAITTIPVFIGYFMTIIAEDASSKSNDPNPLPALIGLGLILISASYSLYWMIATARELRARQDKVDIPSAILLIIPFVNYFWQWRYSKAAEQVTKGKTSALLAFVLLVALGGIGMAILQDSYNKISDTGRAEDPEQQGPIIS